MSDPLKLIARTPVGGYTPGQTINLEVEVINKSDQPVSDFSVQLIKVNKRQITNLIEFSSVNEQLFLKLLPLFPFFS